MDFKILLNQFRKILKENENSIENIQLFSSIYNKINKEKIEKKKKIKISIISDFNVSYLKEILPLFLIDKLIEAEVVEADFGTLSFKIRNPNDSFWNTEADILICIPSFRELSFDYSFKNMQDNQRKVNIRNDAEIFLNFWKKYNKPIIHFLFDLPPVPFLSYQDSTQIGGHTQYINEVNSFLVNNTPNNVNLVDIEHLRKNIQNFKWHDSRMYNLIRQPFSMEALTVYAKYITAQVQGILGLSKKVIITDLDNTLWGGVIGDDGIDGIELSRDNFEAEGFVEFQKYLKKISDLGILLCVCSKNNETIAKEVFKKHKEMILELGDISLFVANFNDKASNIKKISETLNLGLDSFIFVDDSKVECELVKQKLPEVLTVNLSGDSSTFASQIEKELPFYFKNLSEEDLNRKKSYKNIAKIKEIQNNTSNIEEFLKNLETKVLFEKVANDNIGRISQLISKTNQFKFNSKSYSPNEILNLKNTVLAVRLIDKIQNYGIISSLVYDFNLKSKSLIIKNWTMSCRVFSRRLEYFIMKKIIDLAKKNNCNLLSFDFSFTEKNIYLQNFLKDLKINLQKNTKEYNIEINKLDILNNLYISEIKTNE